MKTTVKSLLILSLIGAASSSAPARAADYVIDTKGGHASVNFRIKHLGYSWLFGRFDRFGGRFSFDENNPGASRIKVEIDTASVNSNHAERDNHLRGADFLDVKTFGAATFESTGVTVTGDRKALVQGRLTLHGVTRDITIDAEYTGGGADPWGGHRQGFAGAARLALADYGVKYNLGPAAREVELILYIEGVRQ